MVEEEKVTISNDIDIVATIAYSDKNEKRPLVLLIMGTGSNDRDGNGGGLEQSDLYKNMSDMFVKMGCVCIRYDKRGTHESTGNSKTFSLTDLVNDAANVIQYGKNLEYVDSEKIIACGHSEGSMIATLLTEKIELQGIILLCGACMGLKEAMIYQNSQICDEVQAMDGIKGWFLRLLVKKEKVIQQVNDLYEKANKSEEEKFFFRGASFSTKYIKEHGELTGEKYTEMIKKFSGKTLAITGKADLQTDYTKLENIASCDRVTVYTPEKVNHILREIDDDNKFTNLIKQYKRLLKNDIHEGTKEQIAQWLKNF